MIVSDKALPIRFYNNLYDQNRFNINCHDNCQVELIYPQNKLPQFQFKRDSIFGLPDKFFLRNVCNDLPNYYKEIPEGADTFCNSELASAFYQTNSLSIYFPWNVALETLIPPQIFLVDLFTVDCCSFKMIPSNIPNNPSVQYPVLNNPILTIPISSNTDKYHFKITVDKLIGTSTIQVWNGANFLGLINSADTYDFYFTSTATSITLIFDTISYGDDLQISYMQAYRYNFDTLFPSDVNLNPALLNVVNLKSGKDIIIYCNESSSQFNIPEGTYYYIVKSGGNYYFSEPFKVVTLRTLEKYFKLEWYNDCDLNNSIIYRAVSDGGCTMKNTLYLDAALFKPEYETSEEGAENGQGDINVRFKRWQKSINLEIGKSPEFLTDALSAIFMHNEINITEPLNIYQDVQSQVSKILKVTGSFEDILNECFQKVTLKLLLEDTLTDSSCCNFAEIIDCTPCDYSATDQGGCTTGGYWLDIQDGNGNWWANIPSCTVPRYSYTLRRCNDGTVVNPRPNQIICYMGKYYTLKWVTITSCFTPVQFQFWTAELIAPTLLTATFAFIGFYLTGMLLPNTYGRVLFQPNCTGAWIQADIFQVGNNGNFVFLVPAATIIPYLPLSSICFKVENITQNCFFGETEIKCVGSC